MDTVQVDKLAKIIWDYHRMGHKPEPADAVVGFGSYDKRIAERAIELFKESFAPLLVFCGARGRFTGDWKMTEAETFAKMATSRGVPEDGILIEKESKNTGENVRFLKRLLESNGVGVKKLLVVQKPYMERRVYATFRKEWSEIEVIVASPQVSFDEYYGEYISREDMISDLVGDTQRILVYPERGFLISSQVPDKVRQAYEKLVGAGYTKYLAK